MRKLALQTRDVAVNELDVFLVELDCLFLRLELCKALGLGCAILCRLCLGQRVGDVALPGRDRLFAVLRVEAVGDFPRLGRVHPLQPVAIADRLLAADFVTEFRQHGEEDLLHGRHREAHRYRKLADTVRSRSERLARAAHLVAVVILAEETAD